MLLKSKQFQTNDSRNTWFYDLEKLNKILPFEIGGFALKDRYPAQGLAFNQECDVVFMILDGQGSAFVDGTNFNLSKGDVITIPKQKKYFIKPTMGSELRAWVLTSPKFRYEQHKILNK